MTIRRGTAVTALVTGPEALGGVPHVTGVLLDRGGCEPTASALDRALRPLRDVDTWERAWARYPSVAD